MKYEIRGIKNLKRWLKRKVKITEAVVVMLLITGGGAYAVEPSMNAGDVVEKSISNEVMEKFANPQNTKEYFEYKISFKKGADKEKVLKELRAHITAKQPKYLSKVDNKEESILTQEIEGYKGVTVENYLLNNNAKLIEFKRVSSTWGGLVVIGGAVAIDNNDSNSNSNNNNKSNDSIELTKLAEPIKSIEPVKSVEPIEPKKTAEPTKSTVSAVLPQISDNSRIFRNGVPLKNITFHKEKDLKVITPIGLLGIEKGTKVVVEGNTMVPTADSTTAMEPKSDVEVVNKTVNVEVAGKNEVEAASMGLVAKNGAEGFNEGIITLTKKDSVGMLAKNEDSSAIGSRVINNGSIEGTGDIAMKTEGSGATAINGKEGTINNISTSGTAYGIYGEKETIAENYGTISNASTGLGESIGMKVNGGVASENGVKGEISNTENAVSPRVIYVKISGTGINKGIISNTSTSGKSYGMYGQGEGAEILNKGTISNISDKGSSSGMYVKDGGIATNEGIISNKSKLGGSHGIYGLGKGVEILNKGTISNESGTGSSYGILVRDGRLATNEGIISNKSKSYISYGMYVYNGGKITNKGVIANSSDSVETNVTSYGIHVINGGTAINDEKGVISNSSLRTSIGILVANNNGIALNYGTISNTGVENSIGIMGAAINYGIISNSAELYSTTGMKVEGSGVISLNEANGVISNTSNEDTYGIHAIGGAIATNKGKILNISLRDSTGMYGEGEGTVVENYGIISNASTGSGRSIGMVVDYGGDLAKNEVGGIINNTSNTGNSIGIYVEGEGAVAENYGKISNASIVSGESMGIKAYNKASVENKVGGVISNTSNTGNSYGIYIEDGRLGINRGTISNTSASGNSYGILARGTETVAINYEIISNTTAKSGNSYGIYGLGEGTKILNKGSISNETEAGNSYGMSIENGRLGINKGIISNKSRAGISYGIYALGNEVEILNKGTISNETETGDSYGIFLRDGKLAINEGIILNKSKFNTSYGMFSYNGGKIVNKGVIRNSSEMSQGMYAMSGGTALNYGTISNVSTGSGESIGMKIYDKSLAENGVGGVINNTSNAGNSYGMHVIYGGVAINRGTISNTSTSGNSYGMYASGVGASITNIGSINVNTDGGTGMYGDNGATLDNQGTINLNANNGTGIHAIGINTTVKNSGEIYIDNVKVDDNKLGDVGKNGNQAIKIQDGATFVNNGLLVVVGDLDTTSIIEDGGKLVVDEGTIEAETIKGDYYASGALTTKRYEDTYDTYQIFRADNMHANILSNSAMFSAELTPQDNLGYYGIKMTRKNFDEVVDNPQYAQYLENNYTEANNTEVKEELYDTYKLIATESILNKAVDSTFGDRIYPTFMYQTLNAIRDINSEIKGNIFRGTNFAELEGVRYYGFGKYRNSDTNFDGNELTDYERDLTTVTLGADKAISDTSRVGALVTVGKADYDYDNSDSREDDIYQFNLIGSYEKDNLVATATAYLGKTNGDLDRTLDIPTIHEKMEGDIDNNYYGVDLSLEKRYKLPKFNISPRVELNTIHVEQESINEKGKFALDVDRMESTSVEGGLGFQIDKSFEIENGCKLTPGFSAMYYRELADPYENSTAKLTSVSPDKVKIQGYNADGDRGEFHGFLRLEKNDFGVSIGVNYNIDTEVDEVTPFVGIGYRF